jgi:DNA adenine methylase
MAEVIHIVTNPTAYRVLNKWIAIAEKVMEGGLIQVNNPMDVEIVIEEVNEGKRRKKLLAFRWYGGKYGQLDWLLPLLPKTHLFCEAFAGSAVVLLNREPSEVEVLNDIDSEVTNFFQVLRNRPDELIEKLYLTPFSREEFKRAIEAKNNKNLDPVERARLFFIRAEQVRIGLEQTATLGRWAWCKYTSRSGMAGSVSRWVNRILALWAVAERLREVLIENDDAFNVIKRYDGERTLFYLDPPYPHEVRGDPRAYGFEMSEADHKRLATLLHSVKGKVALSGYKGPLLERLYSDWTRIDAPPRTIHSVKEPRQESLYINYSLDEIGTEVVERLKREMGIKVGRIGSATRR